MATQRYISTSFWDDAWIQNLDPSEKLLYLYLITNPLTNIAGVYKITVRRIVFDTGFNKETVLRILKRFENDEKAYLHGEYMIIPTWPKHQKWEERQKIEAGIVSILKNLSSELLGFLKKIGYTYPIDNLSIPYIYLPNYSDSDLDSDSDSEFENDINSRARELAPVDPSKDDLFTAIRNSFQAVIPIFPKPNQEAKALWEICKMVRARSPDSPTEYAKAIVEMFYYMTHEGNDSFFKDDVTFLPSRLQNFFYDVEKRVLASSREEAAIFDEEYEEEKEVTF